MSTCFNPCSIALRATTSAARWAANGVLLRDPLNPWLPELLHTITFPVRSVIVTSVLLNIAWILRWRGDLAGARTRYERAVALDPNDVVAVYQLAEVLEAQGELQAAEAHLTQALELTHDAAVRQELLAALARVRRQSASGARD